MNNNIYEKQKIRGLKRKYEYVLSRGGKCEICGYDKNIAALEFHHKNPEEKSFQIDMRRFSNGNIENLEAELNKCILVCANCHRELHNPELLITKVKENIENTNTNSFNNRFGKICPTCGKRFPKIQGKKYCSKECRKKAEGKDLYPSIQELESKYAELKSWQKVADFYNITRKITQRIRKSV